jgi:hypothetical protein
MMNGLTETPNNGEESYTNVNRVFVAKVESLRNGKHPSYQPIDDANEEGKLVLVDIVRRPNEKERVF